MRGEYLREALNEASPYISVNFFIKERTSLDIAKAFLKTEKKVVD